MPFRQEPAAWVVLGMAAVFLLLGLAFFAAPGLGTAIFGLPVAEETGRFYVCAIGLRDLALGLYLAGLTCFASRRAVGIVLAATLVIPLGDLLLVAAGTGLASPGHLLLHGLSAAVIAAMAIWLLRPDLPAWHRGS